jgi:hypothetical protein
MLLLLLLCAVPSWFPKAHVSFDWDRLQGDTVSVVLVLRGTMQVGVLYCFRTCQSAQQERYICHTFSLFNVLLQLSLEWCWCCAAPCRCVYHDCHRDGLICIHC